MLPVTLNGGMKMPAWYDILSLDETDENREDMEGVDWAVNFLLDIVREEEKQGISSDRVMVGGFSQGGAVSLRAALTSQTPMAGCVALSCYLPGDVSQYNNINTHSTPIFQVRKLLVLEISLFEVIINPLSMQGGRPSASKVLIFFRTCHKKKLADLIFCLFACRPTVTGTKSCHTREAS